MLRQREMQIVLLTVFLLAISTNAVFAFFGIYLKALGGSTSLVGAASAVAAISEFPVMVLGSWLTHRLGSRRMLIVALSVYTVRILLYSLVPAATWVLAVQLLHGASFGLYLMASTTLVHELVGAELAATGQGLLASAMAFGQMTGSLVGGILLDQFGIFAIFRLSATISGLALMVFMLALRRYGNRAIPSRHAIPERPSTP
jgi:MFS family permease